MELQPSISVVFQAGGCASLRWTKVSPQIRLRLPSDGLGKSRRTVHPPTTKPASSGICGEIFSVFPLSLCFLRFASTNETGLAENSARGKSRDGRGQRGLGTGGLGDWGQGLGLGGFWPRSRAHTTFPRAPTVLESLILLILFPRCA